MISNRKPHCMFWSVSSYSHQQTLRGLGSTSTSGSSLPGDELDCRQQRLERWGWRRRRVGPACSGTERPPSSVQWAEAPLCSRWAPLGTHSEIRNSPSFYQKETFKNCNKSAKLTFSSFAPSDLTHLLMSLWSFFSAGFTMLVTSVQLSKTETLSTAEM